MSLRVNELLPLRVHVEIHDDRAIVRPHGPGVQRRLNRRLCGVELVAARVEKDQRSEWR